jgi:hypothetical protein
MDGGAGGAGEPPRLLLVSESAMVRNAARARAPMSGAEGLRGGTAEHSLPVTLESETGVSTSQGSCG